MAEDGAHLIEQDLRFRLTQITVEQVAHHCPPRNARTAPVTSRQAFAFKFLTICSATIRPPSHGSSPASSPSCPRETLKTKPYSSERPTDVVHIRSSSAFL